MPQGAEWWEMGGLSKGSAPLVPTGGLLPQLGKCWSQMTQPPGLTIKWPVRLMLVTLLHLPVCLSVTISCSLNIHGGRGDTERGPPALPASAVQSTLLSLTI